MPNDAVVEKYSALARGALNGERIVDCDPSEFAGGCFGADGYSDLEGLPETAIRASLGCGNPVEVADIRPGDRVLDLGSGGGIDVLLSARRVGQAGRAYGLDASGDMLELARRNAAEAGADNVEFLQGSIEDVPLPDGTVDVVISNCVISLSVDKEAALSEAYRVLVGGGRLGVSDIVVDDAADPDERSAAEERVGSTEGALSLLGYRRLLSEAGFSQISIQPTADHGGGVHSSIIRAVKPPTG